MRSASARCAIEKIATRGLPSGGVEQRADVERLALRARRRSPGAASRLLSRIASAKRSLAGKNDSRSSTPTCGDGRPLDLLDQRRRGRGRGPRATRSRGCSRARMCSRLRSGSASMPSRPSRLVAVVAIRSRKQLARRRARPPGGAANDLRIEIGQARRAARACRWRSRPRRAAAGCARRPRPTRPSPFRQSSACCAAYASGVSPLRRASSSLTHGAKSSGRSSREGQQQVARGRPSGR